MQVVANPKQKIAGVAQPALLLLGEIAALCQAVEVAFAIADKTDPANELQIAQAAAGALDIGLQHKYGFTVFNAFFAARILGRGEQPPPAPSHHAAKAAIEAVK